MTWGATRVLGSVRGAPFFIPFAIVFSSIGALIEEYTGQSIKQRVEMFIQRLGYNHLLKIIFHIYFCMSPPPPVNIQ